MRRFVVTFVLGLGMVSLGLVGPGFATAQIDQETEYELGPLTLICPTGYPAGDATLAFCTPWEVTVTMVAEDGTLLARCLSPCSVVVPRGSTTIVSIDPAAIPEGYYLPGEPVQSFYAYDWPPNSPELPPIFYVNPIEDSGDEAPIPELPGDESVADETTVGDHTGETVAAEPTDAQGVDNVTALPSTGMQPTVTEASGRANLLMAAASLLLAGVCGLRLFSTNSRRQ